MASKTGPFFTDPLGALEGHRVQLWDRGPQIEAALLRLIDGAAHRIHVAIYEFSDDRAGMRIREALLRARMRGCEVKVVFDAVGSMFARADFFEPMAQGGVEVREYHSLCSLDWRRVTKRNHRKIVCVDSRVALIGGFNFSEPYFKDALEGGYFELALEIEGPAQAEAFHEFDQVWRRAKDPIRSIPKRWQERRKLRRNQRVGNQRAMVIGNDHFTDRWKIRREILFALRHARSEIAIMNPYFLPDPAIVRALLEAKKRGVTVRILVPQWTDVPILDLASNVVLRRLKSQGVEIRRWPGFLHAKGIALDGAWVSVGSFNLDYRSLFHNLEVVVNVLGPAIADQFLATFDREWARASDFSEEGWRALPWPKKLLAYAAYRFRAFL